MSIVEIRSRVTMQSLMRKSKHDLARELLGALDSIDRTVNYVGHVRREEREACAQIAWDRSALYSSEEFKRTMHPRDIAAGRSEAEKIAALIRNRKPPDMEL